MNATQQLHDLGQSLWLDNITRALLDGGTLQRYIDEWSVTGLTSNPTIFHQAIKNSSDYDSTIQAGLAKGDSHETLFFDLAIEDLARAADLFRPIFDRTNGVDGWVSLEVSPLLAYDTAATIAAAKQLHATAARPNLFIKIPAALNHRLGIAVAQGVYRAYRELLASNRWQRIYNEGARPQRLLWASTGTKDPAASDLLYVHALAAPHTVNTLPEGTLKALADHGKIGARMAPDGGDSEPVLAEFTSAGTRIDELAIRLQEDGAKSFVKSWNELISVIASKCRERNSSA